MLRLSERRRCSAYATPQASIPAVYPRRTSIMSRPFRRPPSRRTSSASEPGRAGREPAKAVRESARRRAAEARDPANEGVNRFENRRSESASVVTMKLQKRLAEAGLGSRRAMEALIQAGEVNVNGRPAMLGMRVSRHDRIAVRGEAIPPLKFERVPRIPRIVLYHKPEGEIVSRADPEGRSSVFDKVPAIRRGRWLAIGRLDFNTCGLLIFTDSGLLANRLTHPRFEIRRDYAVRVVGELMPEQLRLLRTGVALDDGPGRFDVIEAEGGEGTNRWYRVSVKEGRNRLIRRMFAAIGVTVSRLMRTRFGPFELPPRIKRGQWLKLEPDAVKQAVQSLDRSSAGPGLEGNRRTSARHPVARATAQRQRRFSARTKVMPETAADAAIARTPRRRRPRFRAM